MIFIGIIVLIQFGLMFYVKKYDPETLEKIGKIQFHKIR
jgi:hypothetical protein